MGCATVAKLKGSISTEQIVDFLVKKFNFKCKHDVKRHVAEIGKDLKVYANYTDSKTWDSDYGYIIYTTENGEKSSVFYSKSNLNFHENYEYYFANEPQNIEMVTSETTYVSHYMCDEGVKIIYALVNEFGGWYVKNDCGDEPHTRIIGRLEKEQNFDDVNFEKRDEKIKKRVDIMTDIETLGRKDGAPIFQVSAVKFDILTGKIIDTFNQVVDITNMKNIEGDTLIWWLNTDKELLTELLNKGKKTKLEEVDVINQFVAWIKSSVDGVNVPNKEDIFLWGNGILFDNRLIKNKCDMYGIEYPIYYRNDRDMRTIVEVAALKSGFVSEHAYRESFPNIGQKHDGFDDARFQVKVLSKAYNLVYGKE